MFKLLINTISKNFERQYFCNKDNSNISYLKNKF